MTTALLLAGCGSDTGGPDRDLVLDRAAGGDPYPGPMFVEQDFSDDATVAERGGAAARALECEHPPAEGGGGDYADGGFTTVQDDAEAALENWLSEEPFLRLPTGGYRVEREDDGRVLFSYDVGASTKVAVIVSDDLRDYNDDHGWGVESWAQCNAAELPPDVSDDLGFEVWEDGSGERLPTSRIETWQGPEHCDWQDVTFLVLDGYDNGRVFLRDPAGKLADATYGELRLDADLPPSARDTGYQREGRRLWLAEDERTAYLVSVDDRRDVEAWPAAKRRISCS